MPLFLNGVRVSSPGTQERKRFKEEPFTQSSCFWRILKNNNIFLI